MSSNITNTNTASVAAVAISAQTYSSRMSEVKCSNEAVINLTAKSKLDYKSNVNIGKKSEKRNFSSIHFLFNLFLKKFIRIENRQR